MWPVPQIPEAMSGTYTPDVGLALKRRAELETRPAHLSSAAEYICGALQANNIPFAIMGGFSLTLRGSTRVTYDVDIAVGCNMLQLQQVMRAQSRLLRPLGPVAAVLRVFVKTGTPNSPNFPELWTMVDLILRGSLGAPDDPQSASEMVRSNINGITQTYPVLRLHSILASKLAAFFGRGGEQDLEDILFLVRNNLNEVYQIKRELNASHRQTFVTRFVQICEDPDLIRDIKRSLGIP